jgi:integrase
MTRRAPPTDPHERRAPAHLVAGGRASATVKKDRAARNSFLRWLAEHEHVPASQVREALAVRLPRAEREAPKALTGPQYDRLIREAKPRTPTIRCPAHAIWPSSSRWATPAAVRGAPAPGAARLPARPPGRAAARRWTFATARATASDASSSALG